jgi:hypothetical protein
MFIWVRDLSVSGCIHSRAKHLFRGRDTEGCLEDSILMHASGTDIAFENRGGKNRFGAHGIKSDPLAHEQVGNWAADFPEFKDSQSPDISAPVAGAAPPSCLEETLGLSIRETDNAGTPRDFDYVLEALS